MSFNFKTYRASGYEFGIVERLSSVTPKDLVELLKHALRPAPAVLGGRGRFAEVNLPGAGKVFVKQYTRGGVYRRLVSKNYLRWGKTRGERECTYLAQVRELGVAAPEPLGFAAKGWPVCRAWLITSFIEGTENMAELCTKNEERTTRALADLVRQISLLVKHSIQHVDLHPGNVLVNPSDTVYILDFDKAHKFEGSSVKLRDYYLRRWRRAVLKHKLPDYLAEIVSLGLRQYEDGERSTYS